MLVELDNYWWVKCTFVQFNKFDFAIFFLFFLFYFILFFFLKYKKTPQSTNDIVEVYVAFIITEYVRLYERFLTSKILHTDCKNVDSLLT